MLATSPQISVQRDWIRWFDHKVIGWSQTSRSSTWSWTDSASKTCQHAASTIYVNSVAFEIHDPLWLLRPALTERHNLINEVINVASQRPVSCKAEPAAGLVTDEKRPDVLRPYSQPVGEWKMSGMGRRYSYQVEEWKMSGLGWLLSSSGRVEDVWPRMTLLYSERVENIWPRIHWHLSILSSQSWTAAERKSVKHRPSFILPTHCIVPFAFKILSPIGPSQEGLECLHASLYVVLCSSEISK